jgi:PAS domain S-box-containing protein
MGSGHKTKVQLAQESEALRQRVAERTAELMSANAQLRREMAERERAEVEIQHRLRQATLLYRVSTLVAEASDISGALQVVCAELAKFLGVPQAGFASLNSEQTAAEVVADYHPPGSSGALGAVIPVADNPSMIYIMEHKVPLAVSDAQVDPRLSPVHDLMRERNVRSILIVPVVAGGVIIGTLGFDSFESHDFSAGDIDVVQLVASQAGQLLMRKRAEAELERRAHEMAVLYQTSLELNSQPDLQTLLEAIVRSAADLMGVHQGGIYLIQADGQTLELAAGYRMAVVPTEPSLRMGEGLVGRAAQSGRLLMVPDYQAWEGRATAYPGLPFRQTLAVPLKVRDRVIGGLILSDDKTAGLFDDNQLRLARLFADQAATAIEKARLLEAERAARAQTEVLREAAQVMGASLEVEEILCLILAQLRRILVYDTASVLVLRGQDVPDLVAAAGYENGEFVSRAAGRVLQQSPILHRMAHDLQPVISDDVREMDGWIWVPGAEHVRSWMCVPLVVHGRMIGALMVDHAETGFFGEGEQQVVQALGQHAAQALDHAQLFEETRRLKAFNESIVQGIAEGILIEDARGAITFVNPAMEAMLGYTSQDLLDRPWRLIVPEDQIDPVSSRMERRARGIGGRYETVLLAKGGRRVPVVVAAQPIFDGGRFSGVLSAFTDITDRVRAERELHERRHYLEAVLASAPDAIVTADAALRLVEWNPGAERLFGYSREEVIGRSLDDLITTSAMRGEATAISELVRGGMAMPPTELVRYRKDASPVDVLLAVSPILVDGEYTGQVGVYTDMGERKQAERALRKANRGLQMLSRSNEVLSRARDESELLREVCAAAVDVGGYRLAWVGVAIEDDRGRIVRPVAQAGYEEGYLFALRIRWDESELGRGPTGTAIRTGKPAIARNMLTDPAYAPWREQATARGYASSVALPLMIEGRAFGALNIYSSEPDAFDAEEVELLAELADNLAYGIMALRTRAERRRAEEVLRGYADRLETLHQIDRDIVEAQSPEAIAQATLDRIGQLVPCRHARIASFGADRTSTVVLAAKSDSSDDRAHATYHEGAATGTVPAEISIPLVAQGEQIGVLEMESCEGKAFAPEEVEAIHEVATPLAVAIQNARLHEQLRQHAGSLEETVTQRTRELKVERDRTQAILESLGEAVIVSDVSGAVLYTNPAVAALTGFGGEEMHGRNWWALQGDERSSGVYDQAQTALRERRTWRGEMTCRRKDGSTYVAEVTVAPIPSPDDSSRLVGSVWVQRDISLLKEADRIKDQFVSNVSHELRTPLSVLTLAAGNLDRLYDRLDDSKRRGMVRSMREQIGLLNDLVGDVLEMSRIDSRSLSTERRMVDLARLVREEVDRQGPLAWARRQVMRVNGPDRLVVHGNSGQLRQVIRNLVDNAIKFTPEEGRITCECEVLTGSPSWPSSVPQQHRAEGWTSGRWAVLRVIDTGIGIEQKDIPHIFERFYRVKTQGNIPGTGLGLSIAQELVELGGGHIAVASTPGEGSVFSVFWPLEEGAHEGECDDLGC